MKKDERMSKDNLMASEVTKNRLSQTFQTLNFTQTTATTREKITMDFNESPCLKFSKSSTATSITLTFFLLFVRRDNNPKKCYVWSNASIHCYSINTLHTFHFILSFLAPENTRLHKTQHSTQHTHHIIRFSAAVLMLIPHVRLNVLHFLFISF